MGETNYIHVHWFDPVPIAEIRDRDEAKRSGLYQVCGNHPAYGPNALLYIGKSEAQTVANRVEADSWELRDAESFVRVGHIKSEEPISNDELRRQIGAAEQLLIIAHKPSHNAREFKTPRASSESSNHVLNWGRRGPLLPEVSEAYWSTRYHKWEYDSD